MQRETQAELNDVLVNCGVVQLRRLECGGAQEGSLVELLESCSLGSTEVEVVERGATKQSQKCSASPFVPMQASRQPRMAMQDFTVKETISKGSFGTVFKVVRKGVSGIRWR